MNEQPLKAFQSGIGYGNDLLPLAPVEPGSTETFDLDIRLRGRELVTNAGYPAAKFTGALTLSAVQNIKNHPYESYKIKLTAYPNFRVNYSIRGTGSEPTPYEFGWCIDISYVDSQSGQSYSYSTTPFSAAIINQGWVLANTQTAEELILAYGNNLIPEDVFSNEQYTVTGIDIHADGGFETDAMLSLDGATPATTIVDKCKAKPYIKTTAYSATRFDETRSSNGAVNSRQGTVSLKPISEMGFPALPPGQMIMYTLTNNSPAKQYINLSFEDGTTQTTNPNAVVTAATDFKSRRAVEGQVKALQPARIPIDLQDASWVPAIPSESALAGPIRLACLIEDRSANQYITAGWGLTSGNMTEYCSYNDDTNNEFGQSDNRRPDDIVTIDSSHTGYSSIGWTSNPRFFEGYINGDGPLMLRRGYRASITFGRAKEEVIDDELYYALDYFIDSEDYYDYHGDFKIPEDVDLSTIKAILSVPSYHYDHDGSLNDQGVSIVFDSNRSTEWSWDKSTGGENVILVNSNTSITIQSDRVWISPQVTRRGYVIQYGPKQQYTLPSQEEFEIPRTVTGDLEYLVSCSNPNVNIGLNGNKVEAIIVDPATWLLRMHSGYYYLNQDEYYLYADKQVRTLKDVGYDSSNRYQMEITGKGIYTYEEIETQTLTLNRAEDFLDYLVAAQVDLDAYPGKMQLAVDSSITKQFAIEGAPINSLAFDEKENIVWIATNGNGVLGVDVASKAIIAQYSTTTEPSIPSDIVSAVDVDGDYIAVGLKSKGIVLIDRMRNMIVARYDQSTDPKLHWHNGAHIADLVFKNGLLYVASANGGGASVIDTSTHTIRYFNGEYYQNYLTSVAYDSGRMAVGYDASGAGGGVVVWDTNNNNPDSALFLVSELRGPYQSVVDVELDGRTVYAVQSRPNCIAVIDLGTGNTRFIEAPSQSQFKTVTVDDKFIYAGLESGICVFDKITLNLVWKEQTLLPTGLGSVVNAVTYVKDEDRTFVYAGTEAGLISLCRKFETHGRFVSKPIDLTADVVDIDPIAWIGDEPAGTSIEVVARTSPDGENWSSWHLKPPIGRYCQYQVELRTDSAFDYLNTPTLKQIDIVYSLARGRQKEIEVTTTPISFMVRGDTKTYQLFRETASEMLWDYIKRSTSYTPENYEIMSIKVRSLTDGVGVFEKGDIVYARTTQQIGLSDVDLVLPDTPQQGAPILIRDERTKQYLRRVTFTDEWGRLSLVNQEELVVGKNSTVFTSYKNLKDNVTAYDKDGHLLDVNGVIGNRLTIYRNKKPLKQGESVRVNYTLRDSFFVDFNYRENAVRFVFSEHYDELTLVYESGRWAPFYEATNLDLNPLVNPLASGFVYLTNRVYPPHTVSLGVSPSWVTSGAKQKANVYCVVADKYGNSVAHEGVTFSVTHGSLKFPDGNYTNNYGVVHAEYTPSQHVGDVTITANVLGTNLSAEANICLEPKLKPQYFLTVTAETTVLVNTHSGDRQETLVTAMVVDERWYPLANQKVTFQIKTGGGSIEKVKFTNASGEAKAVYRTGAASGPTIISALATVNGQPLEAEAVLQVLNFQ